MDILMFGYSEYNFLADFFGGLIIFILLFSLIGLIFSIIQIIGLWKVFKKAGRSGWEAIIPFYSNWVLIEISGLNWWWFLFLFAPIILGLIGLAWLGPIASFLATFNCYYNLAKKFNKGSGFAVGLTFLPPIFIAILGFSKEEVYDNNVIVNSNGFFDNTNQTNSNYQYEQKENVSQSDNAKFSFCGNCGAKLDSSVKYCYNCGKEK